MIFKTTSNGQKKACNKQRNYFVSLSRKTRQYYCSNRDYRKVSDNKNPFWKYVKPLFSDKNSNLNKITLAEKDLILEKTGGVAKTCNDLFTSAISKLNIPCYQDPFIYPLEPNWAPDSKNSGAIQKPPEHYSY